METQKKLYRSKTNRVIAGVAGGLGEYFAIDPVIFRVLFVALAFAGGSGLLLYIIGMLVIPEASGVTTAQSEVVIDKEGKVQNTAQGWLVDRRNLIGLLIVVVGIIALLNQVAPLHWFRWDFFWPIVIIIVGAYLIMKNRR
ncbi:MAG: PspC domain-containing protein [Patescibacteria group bacterium]